MLANVISFSLFLSFPRVSTNRYVPENKPQPNTCVTLAGAGAAAAACRTQQREVSPSPGRRSLHGWERGKESRFQKCKQTLKEEEEEEEEEEGEGPSEPMTPFCEQIRKINSAPSLAGFRARKTALPPQWL